MRALPSSLSGIESFVPIRRLRAEWANDIWSFLDSEDVCVLGQYCHVDL